MPCQNDMFRTLHFSLHLFIFCQKSIAWNSTTDVTTVTKYSIQFCKFVVLSFFSTMNFISAAKITGIVLIILYTIGGFYVLIDGKNIMPWYKVLLGMVFINLINGLLVCGAIKRNGSFLTLWIVLSIIVIISFIIESIRGKEINYSILYHSSCSQDTAPW